MPGPFPGLDPYLERRDLWPDVHQSLITYSRDALQPQIRPRYHARIGERLYVIPPHYLIPYQPWHYVICISRAGRRERFEVYVRTYPLQKRWIRPMKAQRYPPVALPVRLRWGWSPA